MKSLICTSLDREVRRTGPTRLEPLKLLSAIRTCTPAITFDMEGARSETPAYSAASVYWLLTKKLHDARKRSAHRDRTEVDRIHFNVRTPALQFHTYLLPLDCADQITAVEIHARVAADVVETHTGTVGNNLASDAPANTVRKFRNLRRARELQRLRPAGP